MDFLINHVKKVLKHHLKIVRVQFADKHVYLYCRKNSYTLSELINTKYKEMSKCLNYS